ncbi:MAG: DEAD/DEAH box helicase [Rhodospirillaceae bacterium]|nr:DEAD/DEAH box helicase [Rhodospirillaceae bacterium]
MTFSDLGLGPDLLRAIEDAGYTEPTPIQAKAIPIALMGRDILGCAQTGTGKTAGFTLPMIEILAAGQAKARMPRSLIIEPTRELAAQVSESFETYGKHHKLSKALLIGGTSFTDQQKKLERGVDVLIATPGRLIDLFERGKILLSDVKILVIDEADRMLDMGFIPDVERIASMLPKIRQTLFFSATMAPEIRRLSEKFLMNPKEISVDPPASTASTVTHSMVMMNKRDKPSALRALIDTEEIDQAIIFCNRKRDIGDLVKGLKSTGHAVAELHGDMPQHSRTVTLDAFRKGEVKLLVASDVAARGIDVTTISHVFNYDVPSSAEDYVHRIGRTGRAGREGRAFMLATPADSDYIAAITKLIGAQVATVEIPGITTAKSSENSDAASPSRRGGRGRSGQGRSDRGRSDRGRSDKTTNSSDQTAHKQENGQEKSAEKPAEKSADKSPEKQEQNARPQRSQQPQRERKESRPADQGKKPAQGPIVGLGDHVPAFLQQPGEKNKE